MALTARLYRVDRQLGLDVRLDETERERVRDDPPADVSVDWSAWVFEWDADALENGRHEFLGLFVARQDLVADDDIDALDRPPLPRVDVPELRLTDARISSVIRHARDVLPATPIGRTA